MTGVEMNALPLCTYLHEENCSLTRKGVSLTVKGLDFSTQVLSL